MTSTTQYFKKSMNAIYEIDDGAGTTISDGNINCNSFTTANFSTGTLNSSNINNAQNITSDSIATNSGTINQFYTYTINNLANIFSASSQYWKTGGIVMRPFNKYANSGSWFSMNYDDNNEIEKNGLQFDVSGSAVNLIVDDNVPFKISANGIDQLTMTNADGWTFGNKINSTTIHNSGALTTNSATFTTATIPTLNVTTINNCNDATIRYPLSLVTTTQNLTLQKDINNPSSNSVSSFFSDDATTNIYELNGTSKIQYSINNIDALILEQNTATFNNNLICLNAKCQTIQPQTSTSIVDAFTTATNIINIGPTANKIILNGANINLSTSNGSINIGGDIISLNAGSVTVNGSLNTTGLLTMKSLTLTVFKTWTSTFTSTGTLNYQTIIVSLPETVTYSGAGFLLNAYNANYAANTQFYVLGCTPSLANNTPAGSFSRVRLWCYITQPSTVHTVNISCSYVPV